MSQKFEKLKTLLMELFQLDQPDLDFGLYRVMHAKSAEISQFLDSDLLPQVQEAFGEYRTADKAEIEKELAKVTAGIEAAGMDPEQSPKVKELRDWLVSDAVDVGALESEVYDHLFSFFRRYYSEGDFLAKRVYKQGVYAIPYEGEEVTLHWANKDQYYIKTNEYLRDYAFRLKPGDDTKAMRVHFRLLDASEGEHGNVKATAGKGRVFILATPGESGRDFIVEETGPQGHELVILFEYRQSTITDWPEDKRDGKKIPPVQKDLIAHAVQDVMGVANPELLNWITELAKSHVLSNGDKADYTRLEAHLERYTARNTFDYFIHKNLGTFIRRELDFYIKNEVMHLDDVENESAPRVEQYLSKIKVIRKIAGKIIDFLAQLEDFQKKLWLKKKFVVDTQHFITLDRIQETFYPEISVNEAQREEWVDLFSIDEIEGDLTSPSYSVPLTIEFLKAHCYLPVDTVHFPPSFQQQLLNEIDALDGTVNAVLVHGNNDAALRLFEKRYHEAVDCIYSDPPFNTSDVGFIYKNEYRHSSWCSMMANLFYSSQTLIQRQGVIACAIDDAELHHLGMLGDHVFGIEKRLGVLVVEIKPSGRTNDNFLATSHEYYLLFSPDPRGAEIGFFPLSEKQQDAYEHQDDQGAFKWRDFLRTGGFSTPQERPNSCYPIYFRPSDGEIALEDFDSAEKILPVDSEDKMRVWRKTPPSFLEHVEAGEIKVVKNRKGDWKVQIIDRIKDGVRPKSVWVGKEYDAASHGTKLLKAMFGEGKFSFPKSLYATKDVLHVATGSSDDALVLDYFAGSGTTGHAVLQLNREDEGTRRFVLVEVGNHFDDVMIARIKKAVYSEKWKDGKPVNTDTGVSFIGKYLRLESYEDALNNLEVHRTEKQQLLLDAPDAQGKEGLREQYIMRYMLDVETRGSNSLLNVQAFSDPDVYKLKVKRPGSDENREINVDLLETFNWLIGLTVQHIAAPQSFSADSEPDKEKRLRLKGRLKLERNGPYWFRTVTGTIPDGRRTLVIWRKLTGEPEMDNLVLDEWFTKQGYSAKDSEFDLIYVNGGNNLDNLRSSDDLWKVRLIEEDFHRLMFETEGE